MQQKSRLSQSVTIEGNNLMDFMCSVNSLELKGLLYITKKWVCEYKLVILFIALSMLLLIGISLLPKSPIPLEEEVQQKYIHYQTVNIDWLHY